MNGWTVCHVDESKSTFTPCSCTLSSAVCLFGACLLQNGRCNLFSPSFIHFIQRFRLFGICFVVPHAIHFHMFLYFLFTSCHPPPSMLQLIRFSNFCQRSISLCVCIVFVLILFFLFCFLLVGCDPFDD